MSEVYSLSTVWLKRVNACEHLISCTTHRETEERGGRNGEGEEKGEQEGEQEEEWEGEWKGEQPRCFVDQFLPEAEDIDTGCGRLRRLKYHVFIRPCIDSEEEDDDEEEEDETEEEKD